MIDSSALFSVLGHAISVHFVVALFVVATVSYLISINVNKYVIQYQSRLIARWMLGLSCVVVLIAIVFGLFAYSSSRHDDMSHFLLNNHRNVALAVGLLIIILTLWLAVLLKAEKEEGKGFVFVHFLASAALLYVTWTGSVLVYQYGVGVAHLPNSQMHHHRTFEQNRDDEQDRDNEISSIVN